jgi:cytochrome c-type protein NapC
MANQSTPPPGQPEQKAGTLRAIWRFVARPSTRWSLGTLVIAGGIGGIVFWGAFNWSMELTNTESFCITCHEMEANVFREYRTTVHYSNATGVRASCPDCHVPKTWVHKVIRKIQASNELWHHALGSIDTPEKFEAKRMQLAQNVWYAMKTTDSRECRNCHNFAFMDLAAQQSRASERHDVAAKEGKTCIDCHRGIAHRLPEGAFDVDLDRLVRERQGGAKAAADR